MLVWKKYGGRTTSIVSGDSGISMGSEVQHLMCYLKFYRLWPTWLSVEWSWSMTLSSWNTFLPYKWQSFNISFKLTLWCPFNYEKFTSHHTIFHIIYLMIYPNFLLSHEYNSYFVGKWLVCPIFNKHLVFYTFPRRLTTFSTSTTSSCSLYLCNTI